MQSSRENNDDNGNDNDDRQWVIRRWETHREWWGGVEQIATHRQFEIATFNCVFAGKNNAHTHTHKKKSSSTQCPYWIKSIRNESAMSNNCSFNKIKVIIWRPLQRVWVSKFKWTPKKKKNKTKQRETICPSITPKKRRSNSLIFLNQNIYVMNVNFSSLEYLWSSISTAGAIVVAADGAASIAHSRHTMYVRRLHPF